MKKSFLAYLLLFSLAAGCLTQPKPKSPQCAACNGKCCDHGPPCLPVAPGLSVRPNEVTPANARDKAKKLEEEIDWYRQKSDQ